MSNTDKAMELVKDYSQACVELATLPRISGYGCCENLFEALRAHIEAVQRDCRTCGDFAFCSGLPSYRIECTNHNQWTPVEFKQLTRSE